MKKILNFLSLIKMTEKRGVVIHNNEQILTCVPYRIKNQEFDLHVIYCLCEWDECLCLIKSEIKLNMLYKDM